MTGCHIHNHNFSQALVYWCTRVYTCTMLVLVMARRLLGAIAVKSLPTTMANSLSYLMVSCPLGLFSSQQTYH